MSGRKEALLAAALETQMGTTRCTLL